MVHNHKPFYAAEFYDAAPFGLLKHFRGRERESAGVRTNTHTKEERGDGRNEHRMRMP